MGQAKAKGRKPPPRYERGRGGRYVVHAEARRGRSAHRGARAICRAPQAALAGSGL